MTALPVKCCGHSSQSLFLRASGLEVWRLHMYVQGPGSFLAYGALIEAHLWCQIVHFW